MSTNNWKVGGACFEKYEDAEKAAKLSAAGGNRRSCYDDGVQLKDVIIWRAYAIAQAPIPAVEVTVLPS